MVRRSTPRSRWLPTVRLGTLLCLALSLGGSSVEAAGQESPHRTDFEEQISVTWVLVPVVVKGPDGNVDGLVRDEFRLLVDGVEVEIDSFESGPAVPFTLFLLQDLSGSMDLSGRLRSSRQILDYFLDRAAPSDRFALASFAGRRVTLAVPATDRVGLLREAARQWTPYGTTALHDAIAWLPDLLVDRPSARRAVLLISDGLDNASSIDPSEARRRMRSSEIPVYVIGLGTGSPFELTREGDKRYRYADVMNLLAHLTGGYYYSAIEDSEIEDACESVLQDLRHQYILGFRAGGAGEPAARSIEVEVRRKNVQVTHRRSYEGRPPLTATP